MGIMGIGGKLKNLFLLFTLMSLAAHGYELESQRAPVGVGNDKALDLTRDALMSYDYIVERSDYLIYKFKQLTLGEHADNLMFLAPFISGRIEIQAYKDVNFYYNSFSQKGGFRYNVNF